MIIMLLDLSTHCSFEVKKYDRNLWCKWYELKGFWLRNYGEIMKVFLYL